MSLETFFRQFVCAASLAVALLAFAGAAQAQWINELHYDNDGGDEGEAVEVVLFSSADPAAYDLYLYNGSNGEVYGGPLNLATDFTAGATESGYTVYTASVTGIQNGGPDGLALTENGTVVPGQFLSYEGTFTASGGPADGLTSTDIGVAEGGTTAIGESVQLIGVGSVYEDFAWSFPVPASFGGVNTNQELVGPPPPPVVRFVASNGTVAEGDQATLSVVLDYPDDSPDGNPVIVTVAFDGETSSAGEADFGGPTPTQLTFDGTTDEQQQSVTVSVIGGDGFEGNEVAVFDLFIAGGIAEVGTPGAFALTIEDGDPAVPARVQVIHNAADPAAELVDISIVDEGEGDDGASFNDVPFRAATPFFDLAPSTYRITITDEENLAVVIINETVTIGSGETVQLIANGVANPAQFEANPSGQPIEATLFINSAAREASTVPGFVQVTGVHGATDVPAVDVREPITNTAIVDDAIYGDIGEYVDVLPGEYTLDVTSADGSIVFGTVFADVQALGGQAVTVLASGFLTPENDQDGPYIGMLAVLPDGTSFLLPYAVDIAGARGLPLGVPVRIEGVVTRAMGDFTRMQDETAGIVIRQTDGSFNEDVADGTIAPGTVLRVTGATSEFANLLQVNDGDLASYAVLGTTDVPAPQLVTLDEIATDGEAYESELLQVENLLILPDGDTVFQPATTYEVLEGDLQFPVTLRVPNEGDTVIDGEPIPESFATFTGVLGQFDFDDPTVGYQLLPVQEDDIVAQEIVTAPVQIIHNAPDPAFAEVDIYVDGELAFDDFAFRTATPFDGLPAGVEIEVAIAPGDSDSADDAIFTQTYVLGMGLNHQLIATGVGEGDFEPNPDGEDIAFTLLVNDNAQLQSDTDDTVSDFNFVHGTPDAPTIDLRESASFEVIYDDVAYGDVTGYVPIPPDIGAVQITTAEGDELTPLFSLPLEDRIDEAGTILVSGFLSTNNEPDGAPRLGLLVVFADGTTEFLEPFVPPSTEDDTTVPTAFAVDGNYPNPFAEQTTLRYDLPADAEVSVEVYDVLGRRVAEVAPGPVAAGAGRTVTLDAALPSGTYLYRITAELPTGTRTEAGRMTVVR